MDADVIKILSLSSDLLVFLRIETMAFNQANIRSTLPKFKILIGANQQACVL